MSLVLLLSWLLEGSASLVVGYDVVDAAADLLQQLSRLVKERSHFFSLFRGKKSAGTVEEARHDVCSSTSR